MTMNMNKMVMLVALVARRLSWLVSLWDCEPGGIERDGRSRSHGGDGKGGTEVGAVPVGGTEREERKARAGVKHETCLLTIIRLD